MVKETKSSGFVSILTLVKFVTYYGPLIAIITVLCVLYFVACRFLTESWIISWADLTLSSSSQFYTMVAWGILGSMLIQGLTKSILMGCGFPRSSYSLNENMVFGILKRPISYFHQTPIGQLINRATKDLMVNDDLLPVFLNECLMNATYIGAVLMLMIFANPLMIIPVALLSLLLCSYVVRVGKLSTDLRRITGICLSPVISNLSEVVEGRIVVKSFGFSEKTAERFANGMDRLATSFIHERLVMTYFYSKISVLVFIVILFCAVGISVSKITGILFYSKNIFAVTVTNIYIFSGNINAFMYYLSELSSVLSSTERIIEVS